MNVVEVAILCFDLLSSLMCLQVSRAGLRCLLHGAHQNACIISPFHRQFILVPERQ